MRDAALEMLADLPEALANAAAVALLVGAVVVWAVVMGAM